MAKFRVKIDSILGGQAGTANVFAEGQYLTGVAIDPELPISDAVGNRMTSACLRPVGYAKFSSTPVAAAPLFLLTNPKDTKTYAFCSDGKIVSYDSALGTETTVGTITGGVGKGAAYYNNYNYFASGTDISRYGPLNGTAALTNTFWTSTLSLTALTNTTYPSIRGVAVPNHPMHVHKDNKLYIGDFKNGFGMIHYIKTTKTTDEGDTNSGSSYNALDLPFGFMPTAIGSYGEDLAVIAIQTSDSTVNQGKACLFLWDTFNSSFYKQVDLPDTFASAILNVNGFLYLWSGAISNAADVSNGWRLSVYAGGDTVQTAYFSETGAPPLCGAVDAVGDRVVFGTFDQYRGTTASSPTYVAVAKAFGTKNPRLPRALHGIARATAGADGTNGLITALKATQQASFSFPRFLLGWSGTSSTFGIDAQSTTYQTSVWQGPAIQVGQKFRITSLRLPFSEAVAANMTLTPKFYLDDFSSSAVTGDASGMKVINSTNYPNSDRHALQRTTINGNHNFTLELIWSGTALLPVLLPIIIDGETIDD